MVAPIRANKNQITCIWMENGGLVMDQEGIQAAFLQHFKEIYDVHNSISQSSGTLPHFTYPSHFQFLSAINC